MSSTSACMPLVLYLQPFIPAMTRCITILMTSAIVHALNIDHQGFFDDVRDFFDPPRKKPPPPPCFSQASTMTRDECQSQRLSSLQTKTYPLFLGVYKGLKQLQSMALSQIAIGNQANVNQSFLLGVMNGAADPNDGLIGQTRILTNAGDELDATTDKASAAMWGQAAKLQKAIANDTSSLKKAQIAGLGKLQSTIDKANTLQDQLSSVYQGVVTRMGNSALRTIADALTGNQSAVAGSISKGSALLANTTSGVSSNTTNVKGLLSGLQKTASTAPTRLMGSVTSHTQSFVSLIGGSQDSIATATSGTAGSVEAQALAAKLAFEAASEAEFAVAANQWKQSSDSQETSVSSSLVDASSQLDSARDFWSSSVVSSTSEVSNKTSRIQRSVASTLGRLTASSTDYKSKAADLSSALAKVGGSVSESASSASSQATTTASAAQIKMSRLAQSKLSDVTDQLGALNATATQIQAQARSSILESQSQISSEISSLYSEASADSNRLAEQSVAASAALDTGTASVKAKLKANSDAAAAYGEQTASDLMNQLIDLGTSVGDSSQASAGDSAQQAADKAATARNAMSQIAGGTDVAGQQAANNGTAALGNLSSTVGSVMNAISASRMSADDISSRIDALVSSQKSGALSVSSARSSTSDAAVSAADQIASSSAGTAATLASTLSSIQSEAARGANTTALSAQAALMGIVSSAKRSLADTDTAAAVTLRDLQSKQSQLSTKLSSLSGQTVNLESAYEYLGNQSNNQTNAITSSFMQAWKKLGLKANLSSANVLVETSASQSTVQNSVTDQIKKSASDLQTQALAIAQQQQNNLTNSLVSSTGLSTMITSLDQKVNSSKGSYDSVHSELSKILKNISDSMSEQQSEYLTKYGQILQRFSSLKTSANSTLNSMTPVIKNAVTDIPKQIENGATRIIGAASSAADTIAGKIAALQAAQSAATTDAQKEAYQEALNVLYNMQAVNQAASDANTAMLQQIADGQTVDNAQLEGIQDTLVGVENAITGVSSKSAAQTSNLQTSTQDVAQTVSGLFQQLGSSVGQTAASLARNGDAVSSESDFNAQLSRNRNSKAYERTGNSIASYAAGGAADSASLDDARSQVSSKVGFLQQQQNDMQRLLNVSIADVVMKQQRAAAALKSSTKKSDSDVITQMMTIKIAVEGFVSLWNDLAKTMTDRFEGFTEQNRQDLTLVDMALKQSLIDEETKIQKTLRDAVIISTTIDSKSSENAEYERYMSEQVGILKSDQKNMTSAIAKQLSDIRAEIIDYENRAKQADERLRETVKDSLDHLDSDLVQKLVIAHGIATAN